MRIVEKPKYGRQYPTHIGYIDLLCIDKKNSEKVYGNVRTIKEYMKFADIDSFEMSKLNKKAKRFRRSTSRILLF